MDCMPPSHFVFGSSLPIALICQSWSKASSSSSSSSLVVGAFCLDWNSRRIIGQRRGGRTQLAVSSDRHCTSMVPSWGWAGSKLGGCSLSSVESLLSSRWLALLPLVFSP